MSQVASTLPHSPCSDDIVSPETDNELLGPAMEGCPEAFAALFNRHYAAIHAFAYRLCLCAAEAEDIAQETFIQAARSLNGFRGKASFKNWLYTIATNRARDRFRQRQRRDRLGEALAAESEENLSEPHRNTAGDESHSSVRRALAHLTSEQREAITLVYYENLNHAEAAQVIGCAESTVSWRLFRAKTKLRKTLRSHRHD